MEEPAAEVYCSFRSDKLELTEDADFYVIDRKLDISQRLTRGTKVTWLGEDGDGWVKVSTAVWEGYIKREYLKEAE